MSFFWLLADVRLAATSCRTAGGQWLLLLCCGRVPYGGDTPLRQLQETH
jgi:hypothetical protein